MPEAFGSAGLLTSLSVRLDPTPSPPKYQKPAYAGVLEQSTPGKAHVAFFQLTLVVVCREVALSWEVVSITRAARHDMGSVMPRQYESTWLSPEASSSTPSPPLRL